ncbi:BnaC09g31690D [Brassica napus]|uniref:(rape) hypothetical protein n=1 Tax=Brassica napus TaxID=3708 RepID=A0A078G5B2_BRANA|nr:unnamed protein product [Brassica napus]CDY19903.1 BnaC09g31690D [Brassica napus]
MITLDVLNHVFFCFREPTLTLSCASLPAIHMVEVEIPQSLFEEQGRQFYGARLLDSGKHLTLFLLFSFIGNMKLTEEQLASLQHNLAVGDIFKCENLEFSTDELVKEVDNSITEFKKHKQEYDGECVKDLSIFFGIILDT